MLSTLTCFHHVKSASAQAAWSSEGAGAPLTWATCLREIAFFPQELGLAAPAETEVYTGEAAYRFCLEVICGLKSPLLGETEVMGQFKAFVERHDGHSAFDKMFRKFANNLWTDAKRVRSEFLKDLGSQSYGSLARRWVKSCPQVHFVGYGHLAQEMQPWLSKGSTELHFHVRSSSRVTKQPERLHELNECGQKLSGALIIAAPISNEEIIAWLANQETNFQVVIDLRDTSARQPLNLTVRHHYRLQDAFDLVEQGREKRVAQADLAREAIAKISQDRYTQRVIRPFGWDDLCA